MKYILWRIRWWKWFLLETPFIGDPRWGSGPQRKRNLDIAFKRWEAKEPTQ